MKQHTATAVLLTGIFLSGGCGGEYDDVSFRPPAPRVEPRGEEPDSGPPASSPSVAPASHGDELDDRGGRGGDPADTLSVPEEEPTSGLSDDRGPSGDGRSPRPAPGAQRFENQPPSAATAEPAQQPSVRLSAGVALPQTLPTGTGMSFSVDYRFEQGQPDPSTRYLLVIERSRGEPLRQPVNLRNEGNLGGLVPGWRPEEGPFQAHVEDRDGRRLSRSISLR